MALGAEAHRCGESFKWYEHGEEVCYWWRADVKMKHECVSILSVYIDVDFVSYLFMQDIVKKNKQNVCEADITEEYLSDLIENALM